MTTEQYNKLREKYGEYSSFMMWKDEKNVGDISMFENDDIASQLNSKYVFVALNPAGANASIEENAHVFKNFHSDYSHQKDFKLCFAVKKTKYWGSYITDLFKSFHLTDSHLLNKELKSRPQDVEKDKEALKDELDIIGKDVVIVALGRKTEHYLKMLLKDEYEIKYVKHYSYYSSKEKYREELLKSLGE